MSDLQSYVGTKLINAKPMNRQAYNDFRGWQLPSDKNGDDEGYLVEYNDGGTMLGIFENDLVPYRGYYALKLADNTVTIFNPCPTELSSDDWIIVD